MVGQTCHYWGGAVAAVMLNSVWQVAVMLVLVCCSAFFSGAETAFFSLSRRQRALLKQSRHRLHRLAGMLLERPGRLLSGLLFGNMLVNVLYFAAASILTANLAQRFGMAWAGVGAFASFVLLILFGEILPKSLAYSNARLFSATFALPVYVCLQVFAPLVSGARFLVVEPVLRLALGARRAAAPVGAEELRSLVDRIRSRGLITTEENRLFDEIIELGFLKVRDCLRPRVDMVACDVREPPEKAVKLMLSNNLTKLPVYVGKRDNIVGMVHIRQILLNPGKGLDKIVQKVHFVPEQKSVVSLLEFFRSTATDTAIVVDEYGGVAGSICLEDIAAELLGPIDARDKAEPVAVLGPLKYRLAGALPLRDWADAFGIDASEMRFSTVGGWVSFLLGRIPKVGDEVRWKNVKFTVEKMRRKRVETVIMTIEPICK